MVSEVDPCRCDRNRNQPAKQVLQSHFVDPRAEVDVDIDLKE
jgi:hypothetical protein